MTMTESYPTALEPFGRALLAYWRGDESARLVHEFRSGRKKTIPASVFFRTPAEFFPTENAFPYCRGRVLVVGAGTGVHALELERTGFDVTAIDICQQAVQIMREQELKDVRHADFFHFKGDGYDTILMLGQNIGMAGTLDGLPRLLRRCKMLLNPQGRLLANSVAEPAMPDAVKPEAYPGHLEFRLQYRQITGPWMQWLHADIDTLAAHARQCGWRLQKLADSTDGSFLAKLSP